MPKRHGNSLRKQKIYWARVRHSSMVVLVVLCAEEKTHGTVPLVFWTITSI